MYEAPHWTDHAATPVFKTVIPATGSNANINFVLSRACRALEEIEVPAARIDKLRSDVRNAVNYDQAVAFIEYWFPVERDDAR
jgi:hypothetical protein